MAEPKSYREGSRIDWASEQYNCPDQIKLGCLLRIADATEKMAQSYSALIYERDRYKKWYEEKRTMVGHLYNRINGLRGTITKMKEKANRVHRGIK